MLDSYGAPNGRWHRDSVDNSFTLSVADGWFRIKITVNGSEQPPPVHIDLSPHPSPPAFEVERFSTTEKFENRLREKMAAMVQSAAIFRGEFGYKAFRAPKVPKLRPEVHARSHPSCERRRHC